MFPRSFFTACTLNTDVHAVVFNILMKFLREIILQFPVNTNVILCGDFNLHLFNPLPTVGWRRHLSMTSPTSWQTSVFTSSCLAYWALPYQHY